MTATDHGHERLTREERDHCVIENQGHAWVLRSVRGHDEVHCERCMRCMYTERMLDAYVKLHGGSWRRG